MKIHTALPVPQSIPVLEVTRPSWTPDRPSIENSPARYSSFRVQDQDGSLHTLLQPLSHFDNGRVPTLPEAGELHSHGRSNFLDQNWQQQIALAVQRNGGMGNSVEGCLAWGKHGFFRFKNDSYPAELNRRYAEMSLLLGIPIEELKSADPVRSQKDLAGRYQLIQDLENALQKMLQNPTEGFNVKSGSQLYLAGPNDQSAGITFFRKKRPSGWKRTLANVFAFAGKALSVSSFLMPAYFSLAQAISTALQGVQNYGKADEAASTVHALEQAQGR